MTMICASCAARIARPEAAYQEMAGPLRHGNLRELIPALRIPDVLSGELRPEAFQPEPCLPFVRRYAVRFLPASVGHSGGLLQNSICVLKNARELSCQILCFQIKEPRDNGGVLFPIALFGFEQFSPRPSDPVKPGAPVVFRRCPRRRDGSFLLKFQENRIERSLVDREQFITDLRDSPGNSVPVQRAQNLKCLQDHQRQRPLLYSKGRWR